MGDVVRFTGAVLAGGASRRMGRDKAAIEVGGVTMLARATAALYDAGAESVLVIGGAGVDVRVGLDGDGDGDGEVGVGLDRTVHVDDGWPGEGPLGGLITALDATDSSIVVVIACDLVWLDAESIRAVVTSLFGDPVETDTNAPRSPGTGREPVTADVVNDVLAAVAFTDRREPLCAAWRRHDALAVLLSAFVDGERSIARVLDRMPVIEVCVRPWALTNVNTPEELAEAAREAAGADTGATPVEQGLTT